MIRTLLIRPHRWYDNLPEPRRFPAFLFPMLTAVCAAQWWPAVIYPGLCVFGLWRVWYLNQSPP